MTDISNVTEMRTLIATAFAARAAFELAKDANNSNMQKNLSRYAKDAAHDKVAEVFAACSYDVSHINRNAYSVEKAVSTARYCASVDKLDVYTNAIFDSMLVLEAAQIEITRDVISSMCSVDAKNANAKIERAIKPTRVQTHKSTSTVATQHNSSINAMLALHMLNAARNAANDECFTLDRSNFAVQAIAARKEVKLIADETVSA